MKRVIAVLLFLILMISLLSCNKSTPTPENTAGNTTQNSPAQSSQPEAGGSPTGSTENGNEYGSDQTLASGFGLFRQDFDYSSMPKFRVVGMFNQMNSMFEEMNYYFEEWAKKTNCDYSVFDASGDSDAFLNAVETFAGQGVNGVIINPDAAIMPRLVEVLDENDMNYMSGFSAAIDNDNKFKHPFVGTDNYAIGHTLSSWLAEYAETIDGFNLSDARIVWVDWSTSNEVHLRGIGVWYGWDEHFGNSEDAFIYIDAVSEGQQSEEAGYNLMSATIVSNPDVKYWLVATTVEPIAFGVVRALEDYNLADTSAIANNGADSKIKEWDVGVQTCYRASNAIPQATRTNAYWNALYAFMAGWATPESIWPDCTSDGETFAYVVLEPNMVNADTYKNFFGWGDVVSGTSKYGYDWDGTEYTAYAISKEYPMLWTQVTFDPTNGQFTK